jgi:aminomethyltransferase
MAFDPATVVRQYGDPYNEVRACRTACALFDFSFMTRARLRGSGALAAIAQLTRRPLADLAPGGIRYAVRENASGHLVSDLTIWRHADHYQVMSGRSEDITDLISVAPPDAGAEDVSGAHAIFAVQGPGSLEALGRHMDVRAVAALRYFRFAPAQIDGVPCQIGRLGYTGEPGFEIVLPHAAGRHIWQRLAQSAQPAGFIAADALRIEAGFVLFTNEFRVLVTAREAGLERFAGIGGLPTDQDVALVCFRASARERPILWQSARPVGRPAPGMITITSACHSLAAGGTLGLGFARRTDVRAGVPVRDPHGAFADIRLVPLPFLDPHKRRPRAAWGAARS